MKKYLETFLAMQDETFLKTHIQALLRLELPQTYSANHRAMDYAEQLLQTLGFETDRPDVAFDGETVYYDKVMPLCWEVDHATLTVLSDWDGNRVIADYKTEPFSVIRGSTATPEGGIDTRLVPWDRMKAGEDCRGALILLPQTLFPTDWVLPDILNSGAIGLVSGTTADNGTRPDDLLWANNCSETNCWHAIKGDRNFIGYSVSPNMQRRLEQACSAGEVRMHAECDGRRFEGKMPVATAFLPGESKKEFWILAHNGEPMENDNNNGVALGIYTLYAIKKAVEQGKIPPPKYSIRLLLTPELYGFAACANYYGPILKDRCIGAVSFDGIPARHHFLNLGFAPTAVPFYSNVLMEAMWRQYAHDVDLPPYIQGWNYSWSGDSFLSDADIGLPTMMPMYARSDTHCWHNSHQRFDYIN